MTSAFELPDIVAPGRVPGQLVTWNEFHGASAFHNGWMAWIGAERIGRIDVDVDGEPDGCEWFCALPCEDDRAVDGKGTFEECRAAIEAFAENWVRRAGLAQV